MSADIYSSEIDESQYGSILIEMKASGLLVLSCENFMLPATKEGWEEASKLIDALQQWISHTKELDEQRVFAEGLTLGLDR